MRMIFFYNPLTPIKTAKHGYIHGIFTHGKTLSREIMNAVYPAYVVEATAVHESCDVYEIQSHDMCKHVLIIRYIVAVSGQAIIGRPLRSHVRSSRYDQAISTFVQFHVLILALASVITARRRRRTIHATRENVVVSSIAVADERQIQIQSECRLAMFAAPVAH
jgi:hypothetical protein